MRRLINLPLALVAGALLALGFAPFGQALAPVAALAIIFSRLTTIGTLRGALATGYVFGLGYAGAGVYWIYHSIADYGGGPLAGVVATAVLVALFALIPMIALVSGWWVGGGNRLRTPLLALPLAWIGVEWIRSWLATGATWLSLGYTQIDTPLAHLAPVFGVVGVSLAVVMTAGAIAAWLAQPGTRRFALALGIALATVSVGLALDRDWTVPIDEPLSVSILQGNIGQARKWDPDERGAILGEYLQMTRDRFGDDLIVWPETALPVFYQQATRWIDPLAREAADAGSSLVIGAPVARDENRYNAVVVPGDPPQFYEKRHLVPFGEYVPFRDIAGGVLDFVGTPLGDFSAGQSAAPLRAAGHDLGVSICYEVTFGAEVADTLPAADLLLNVSNDAWFGASTAPWQHLQMARMRALETGREMIRATNTGVSAFIDSRGAVRQAGPLFESAILSATVQPRAGTTPYVRWRDWPMAALSMIGIAGLWLTGGWRRPGRGG
ncbi:apolipoprotein N-acyltransferase [Spiribacter vilamensis]|uniref:Apolipoprotein N-acyltransferase n=1 Tax=Spiribacter vilamensis TaxID=531306 RepID=A0A4Q8CY53_9GAMM|nr:apolipoprotein N-acyltransferase [Spiribacter vilamensis]RZU97817.1 apolipoprotein N-acyltransferase [Spiribacter vilamensis]